VQKTSIVVQLLLGDIPERQVFNTGAGAGTGDAGMSHVLEPYLALSQAVRVGDLEAFEDVVRAHASGFSRDDTLVLIRRLRQNVIRAGLRKVATSYKAIRFADIAGKLGLASADDAEYICAKAVRDGVIDAVLVHERDAHGANNGHMHTRAEAHDYEGPEPIHAFHRRIEFCLDLHNEAVRSMEYPPGAFRRDKTLADARKEREDEEAELAEVMEQGFDDEPEDDADDL
jgi:26S proteasome regulatory subunit N3